MCYEVTLPVIFPCVNFILDILKTLVPSGVMWHSLTIATTTEQEMISNRKTAEDITYSKHATIYSMLIGGHG